MGYPSQDPRGVIDISKTDLNTIEQNALAKLDSLGISRNNYQIKTKLYGNQNLLEGLQYAMGRDKMIDWLKQEEAPNFKPYFWNVEITFKGNSQQQKRSADRAAQQSEREQQDEARIQMHYSPSGEFLEFSGSDNLVPLKRANINALASTFGAFHDEAYELLSTYSDSYLNEQLLIDFQQNWAAFDLPDDERLTELQISLEQKDPFRLSSQDVFEMAKHHIQQTGWNINDFVQDTAYLGRTNGRNIAIAKFSHTDSLVNQELSLQVKLTSAGSLAGITSTYNNPVDSDDRQLWSTIRRALLFLFCLAGIVLFFFRIRARAIDTQPALVVAVIAGLGFSLMGLLTVIPNTSLWTAGASWDQSIELIVRTGLAGAAASLAYFVFFAIGDSITRQHWPQKLSLYDYICQGMVFNKPIGFMLIRSVALSFILAGVWTSVVWLFPQISFHIHNEVFVSQQVAWPPVFLGVSNGVFSLGLVVGIFLVFGGQIFSQTKSKVITGIVIILACGIVVPFAGYLEANGYQFVAGSIMGVVLLGIYLQWDFLTLLVSHFLFSVLTSTTTGWIISGSLDTYVFISGLIFLSTIFVTGVIAVGRGKEEKVLSRYIPEYVEELAQEERIKQELEIAREVQQSFLPTQKPHFKGLDMAAICKPAFETGGDYYDFIQLDDHRIAVTIGDVSGKGFQAAFYMTFIKGILHSLCWEIDSPAEILKKVNRLFYDNAQRGTFISLVYGIIDLQKQTFTFARAGHNPILKVGSNGSGIEELKPSGIGIGLSKDSFDEQIQEVTLSLVNDEILILYTDGIVEALNEHHKFYGTDRFNKMVSDNAKKSAKQILDLLAHDVRSFVGEAKQHDDMTIMVMKMNDK